MCGEAKPRSLLLVNRPPHRSLLRPFREEFSLQTVRELNTLRQVIANWRSEGLRVALVPTMGALHAGHMALVEAAKGTGRGRVVASIFVNPRQFGPNEDLARYPRREASDAKALTEAGCDLLWLPTVEVMYPHGFATSLSVAGIGDHWDGAARPGHFEGVATVVTKLFNQVRPDVACFGEKDWQQLALIRQLVADLDIDVEIVGVPTQRDDDGLALSSRNIYLDDVERAAAVALPRSLGIAAQAIARGGNVGDALNDARVALVAAGFQVDYLGLADAETLQPDPAPDRSRRLLAAARIGTTRLIDNIAVEDG
jgi:pantoate--beta-alanine ligase